ncbi:hypothetical protein CDAR_520201 [Caerostris darwini]|uniref:Uncharacterized protein n=1 Tax=Caerostris darwini TaxID=1538125 RepID=A0AAV4TT58_9ARAC|nr:hypothetical protein CDAR_520201 [Caerostris darwini]
METNHRKVVRTNCITSVVQLGKSHRFHVWPVAREIASRIDRSLSLLSRHLQVAHPHPTPLAHPRRGVESHFGNELSIPCGDGANPKPSQSIHLSLEWFSNG